MTLYQAEKIDDGVISTGKNTADMNAWLIRPKLDTEMGVQLIRPNDDIAVIVPSASADIMEVA